MSINDLVHSIEDLALRAVLEAKAVHTCMFHSDALISYGDPEAEKLAYAIATNRIKANNEMFLREDVLEAVKDQLEMADDECNQCAAHRED